LILQKFYFLEVAGCGCFIFIRYVRSSEESWNRRNGVKTMAVLLQVNYTPNPNPGPQAEASRLASAENIANNVAGLQWKVWIGNTAENLRGGIYLFDDLASARTWGEGKLRERLAANGGTNVSVTYFDVDEQLSAVTRAPIAAPHLAA
jgi:hypothetical protein